jgi:GNAT superfamily N-acetyltransferase
MFGTDLPEFINNITSKLKPVEVSHQFVSHEDVAIVYSDFLREHPESNIRLVNHSVNYVYNLKPLSQEEQQEFINYCSRVYGSNCSLNETSRALNINCSLISNSIEMLPDGFAFRNYPFHVYDSQNQYAGILGLVEKSNINKPFSLDIFLEQNAQGKGLGSKALRNISCLVDDPRLGCEIICLAVGSQNEKAALVYARNGYKPTQDLLQMIADAYSCTKDEAFAQILFNSKSDDLPSGIRFSMIRERGAKTQIIDSAWNENDLLAFVKNLNLPPKARFPLVATIFNNAAPNNNNMSPNKANMDVVFRN